MAASEVEVVVARLVKEVAQLVENGATDQGINTDQEYDHHGGRNDVALETIGSVKIEKEIDYVEIVPRRIDQSTQTSCTCQCMCGTGSWNSPNVPRQVRQVVQVVTPNKRKRGRPRKVVETKDESERPRRGRKRGPVKNVSYPELEGETKERKVTKVTTVNCNKKLTLPTLKIKLNRVRIKKENPLRKSHAEFKREVLKNLKFVDVSNASHSKTNVQENSENTETLNDDDDSDMQSSMPATPSERLVYEETHECASCGKRFKEQCDLKEHRKKQHDEETEEEEETKETEEPEETEETEETEEEMNGFSDGEYIPDAISDHSNPEESDPEFLPDSTKSKNTRNYKKKGKNTKDIEEGELSDSVDIGEINNDNMDLSKLLGEGTDLMEVPQKITEKGETILTCVICNKIFKGEAHFLRHLGTHTGHRPYVCSICGTGFNRKTFLKRHMSTHNKDYPFSCDICNKRLKTEQGLKRHLDKHLNPDDKPCECDECGKKFSQEKGLEVHKSTIHKNIRPYKCQYCEQGFGRLTHLIRHTYLHKIEQEGVPLPFECVKCGKRFAREEQLKVHDRIHTGERPYPCLICDKAFKSSSDLSAHTHIHTEERNHVCLICGASFKQKRGLDRHMLGHSDDRPHVCEFCGLSFKHQQSLKLHSRIHTGLKPYTCQVCDYSCAQLGNLQSHMAKHSDERRFTCDVCGKQFKHQKHMKRHMDTHIQQKNYKCEICGKKFSREVGRRKHMLVHSGQKPFSCKVCSRAFRQPSTLRTHMMVHNNHRPFNCDLCSATFRRSAHLERHMRTHSGEKPYACKVCGKRFTRPVCLPAHMKRHERQGECPPLDTLDIPGVNSITNKSDVHQSYGTHTEPGPSEGVENLEEEYSDHHGDDHVDGDNQSEEPTVALSQHSALHPFLFTLPYYTSQSAWPSHEEALGQ